MLRARQLNQTFVKRTIRPLYPTVTPQAETLDLDDRIIVPGMVLTRLSTGKVTIASLGDVPVGLSNNWVNGELDELGGTDQIGMWTCGLFEIQNVPDHYPMETDGAWSDIPKVFWNDKGKISGVEYFVGQQSIGTLMSMYNNGNKIFIDLKI